MPHEHEHELIDNTTGKPIGKAWWDSKSGHIMCSNQNTFNIVFGPHSLVHDDDESLIQNLSRAFKNGYITAKKVK